MPLILVTPIRNSFSSSLNLDDSKIEIKFQSLDSKDKVNELAIGYFSIKEMSPLKENILLVQLLKVDGEQCYKTN